MNKTTSGNSRQSSGDDRPRRTRPIEHWSELRGRTLRFFVRELIATHKLRGAEALTGLSKEALRKIGSGKSRPNLSSRQTLGRLFLELYPEGTLYYLGPRPAPTRPRLIDQLPPREDDARTAIAKLFELAGRFPDEAPALRGDLAGWLLEQLEIEYAGHRLVFGDAPVHNPGREPPSGDPLDP